MNTFTATLAPSDQIAPLRELRRHELHCQIITYSWFGRGWTDGYLLHVNGQVAGYGLVGGVRGDPKDTIIEFYVMPAYRAVALPLFHALAESSRAKFIETQSNDLLLTLMLYDCASEIEAGAVLFHDACTTSLTVPGATFRQMAEAEAEQVFPHAVEPVGEYVIEENGQIVATGGFLCHYNVPYADIYMEVAPEHRQRGYGSYLVQELKRTCYEQGKVPAARCNPTNAASRATLQKAGLLPCARLLTGKLTS